MSLSFFLSLLLSLSLTLSPLFLSFPLSLFHSFTHSSHSISPTHFLLTIIRRASSRIQIAKATAEGTLISDPYELTTDWETANFDVRHANRASDGSSW